MVALISLFIILTLSITVVRIGAIALELTGISPDVAGFQAQSAFSGTGFTTTEAETIVNHPVRRKIIRVLILVGSAGITSVIATVILTFADFSGSNIVYRSLSLFIGLVVIYFFARSKIIYRFMKKIIVSALSKNTKLKFQDYYEILGIEKGYSIARMKMKRSNWAVGKKLKDLKLNQEGTLILSIHRMEGKEQKFIIPSGETVIKSGDELTTYGRCAGAECLSSRPKGAKGDQAHDKHCGEEKNLEELYKG